VIVFTSTQTDLHGQAATMTTESMHRTRSGSSPLLGALGSGAVAVVVLAVAAVLLDGRPAVVGAVVGGLVTLAVFGFGTALVSLVARMVPAASLLVALLTYTLQLLVLALVVAGLERADLDAATLSRGWFAAGVIAVTALWLVGQVVAATRQRIPVYESPEADRTVDHPGGER
jgi:ATP synthase protein I